MATIYDYNNPFGALAAKLPAVRLTAPPAWFFKIPPAPFPRTVPSPPDHPTLAHPFTISTELYNNLLDARVPFTVAIIYITVITFLNSLNKSREYKPWAFSKTRLFKLMVLTHNVILAVYSAWTFVGMFNALKSSVYNPYHAWGVAGTVDSLCKVNGPRGMGSAAVYDERNAAWSIANRFFHLGADGLGPDATDVGRLWNEGLAFYGWLFYLSKFYEVIDTLIIIAKGKKSSFLQTYHHAGAMICMWAGIRYMSPPIWMFVFVNSFIHSIMYSFYFVTALDIRVPVAFKRTLTTLQITQFVVGVVYAFSHLVIEYQSPHSILQIREPGSPVHDIVSDVSSVISVATATVTAPLSAHIKKALLRAAGREGLAENVLNEYGRTFGVDAEHAAKDLYKRQVEEYRDELQWTHCISTSGQAFAIYLNVLYLLPLTLLFVRFFVKSYLRRLERRRSSTATIPVPVERRAHDIRQSFSDASKGTRREVLSLGEPQDGDESDVVIVDDTEFEEQKEEVKREIKQAAHDVTESVKKTSKSASKKAKNALDAAEQKTGPALQTARDKAQAAAKNTSDTIDKIKQDVTKTVSGENEGMNRTLEDLKQQADSVKAQSESIAEKGYEKAEEVYESVKTPIVSTKNSLVGDLTVTERAKQIVDDTRENVQDGVQQGTENLSNSAESVSQTLKESASSVQENLASTSRSAKTDDGRDAPKPSSQGSETQDHTSNDQTSSKDESKTSVKTDSNTVQAEPAEAESKDDKEEGEQENYKEEVRDSVPTKGSETESSTGKVSKSGNKSSAQIAKSKSVAASKKPNKEDLNIKNTNDQKHDREDVSNEESATQESDTKEGVEDTRDPTENTDAIQENNEGRQSFFKGERKDALEKLKSANKEGDDQAIPNEDDVEPEQNEKADESSQSKKPDTKSNENDKQDDKPSFEETRSDALEKLQSANSQSQEDNDGEAAVETKHEPSRHAKEEAAEALADADTNQDFEDQKESWIDVGKSREKSQTDNDDQADASKNDKATSSAEATGPKSKNTEENVESEQKSGTPEPEWFERLTTSTDGKESSGAQTSTANTGESAQVVEGITFADVVKESASTDEIKPAADGDHGFGIFDDLDKSKDDTPEAKGVSQDNKADEEEKAEQDKIIDESEPVRDEIQDDQKEKEEAGA